MIAWLYYPWSTLKSRDRTQAGLLKSIFYRHLVFMFPQFRRGRVSSMDCVVFWITEVDCLRGEF